MDALILEVEDLVKTFRHPITRRKQQALSRVSFGVSAGRITGFLGSNGAGKTTTMKCCLDLIRPDSGRIMWMGQAGFTREARRKTGFLPERPYFYEYLTGREFLHFYGRLSERISNSDLKQRAEKLLERVGLAAAADRPLRGYSKGMLQRVGIAQALIHQPEFVILDEPMTGLDPDGRAEVRNLIAEVRGQGTTVFFSSHLLHDAELICDDLVILRGGAVVYSGPLEGLMHRNSSFSVSATRDGQRWTAQVESDGELQSLIDRWRRDGIHILEIQRTKVSLEEAFLRVAGNVSKAG